MAGKWLIPMLVCAFAVSNAAAQSKSSSSKANTQKQEAAKALRQEVASVLADADGAADPERGYDLLRRALHALAEPSPLAGRERLDLVVRVEERMDKMRHRMTAMKESKSSSGSGQASSASSAAKKQGQFAPVFASSSNAQVTPVVSADRRFVRIGIRGTFGLVTPGPLVPVQIPVPQFLYGPGKGFTADPPEKIFQMFFPQPKGTLIRINSTAGVPSGGLASLGGFSNSMTARNEFGVPGLGKVPYGGRLFRNVAQGADQSSIRIGVSARVISLAEEEQRFLEQGR